MPWLRCFGDPIDATMNKTKVFSILRRFSDDLLLTFAMLSLFVIYFTAI